MHQADANRLVEFLDGRADDYLRGVLHYSADEHELLYLRDDVDELYSDEDIGGVSDYYRQQSKVQATDGPFSLGNCHCNVSFYDKAIIFHFAQGDDVGTVVTLEPEAGRNIVGFITKCLKQLHHDSPQTIENVPDWIQD